LYLSVYARASKKKKKKKKKKKWIRRIQWSYWCLAAWTMVGMFRGWESLDFCPSLAKSIEPLKEFGAFYFYG
jgi:hypothetical protein